MPAHTIAIARLACILLLTVTAPRAHAQEQEDQSLPTRNAAAVYHEASTALKLHFRAIEHFSWGPHWRTAWAAPHNADFAQRLKESQPLIERVIDASTWPNADFEAAAVAVDKHPPLLAIHTILRALDADAARHFQNFRIDKAVDRVAAMYRIADQIGGHLDGFGFLIAKPWVNRANTATRRLLARPIFTDTDQIDILLAAIAAVSDDDPLDARATVAQGARTAATRYTPHRYIADLREHVISDYLERALLPPPLGAPPDPERDAIAQWLSDPAMKARLSSFRAEIDFLLDHWHLPPPELHAKLLDRGWRERPSDWPRPTTHLLLPFAGSFPLPQEFLDEYFAGLREEGIDTQDDFHPRLRAEPLTSIAWVAVSMHEHQHEIAADLAFIAGRLVMQRVSLKPNFNPDD